MQSINQCTTRLTSKCEHNPQVDNDVSMLSRTSSSSKIVFFINDVETSLKTNNNPNVATILPICPEISKKYTSDPTIELLSTVVYISKMFLLLWHTKNKCFFLTQ